MLAATAGLATVPGAAAQDDSVYVDWNPLFPGFATGYRPSTERDCADGSDTCIDRTIAEMYRRFHTVVPTCDHNAVFSITYIRVTEAIKRAVEEGMYADRRWINHQDAVFARMYYDAYDNWAGGRLERVAPAWRLAFDAARNREVQGIGNLLMAMNAHINRDMPFMLYGVGIVAPDGRSRKPDHDVGNRLLANLYRPVLAELSQRFDPTIDDYDAPGTLYDDTAIFQTLQAWRERVFRNAERLHMARDDAERRAVAESIEQDAVAEARSIYDGSAYRGDANSAARDAHCARFGGQDPLFRHRGGVARPEVGRGGLRASRRGSVAVPLVCSSDAGTCRGTVSLRSGRRRLGRRAFALLPGHHGTVRVRLTRAARRWLRRSGRRARAAIVVQSQVAVGDVRIVRASSRLRPRAR